ncbi:beta strand repeat-containing protein [Microbacterium sp. NPDC008134]|uniref:beta strand repeat-containing protein n=1 Tax=Microbacterium sp. NPDC008134 TaxID=3364183 RepID=UPI0036E4724E
MEGVIRRAPRWKSFVAMLTAATLATVGLTLAAPTSAEAVVVQWGTNSGESPNYQANVNGDFLMSGNGVLACTSAATTTVGTCNDLHAASSSNTENVNDNFVMSNSNTVAGFTTNSSSATINVPAGATVVKAFLTWSANTGAFTGDTRMLCASYSAARGVATMPTGSATGYLNRAIQFKVGSGATANVSPQNVLVDPTSQATARYYSASADVTAAFANVSTGSDVTLSAGNIWAPTGAGCYAGWSVTVVYDYGTFIPGNAASVPHNIIYYEGHVRQGASDPDLTVAFNGFTAVAPGTRAGFTLFEGDRNITGDTASYSRGGSSTFTAIPNAAGASNNFGIGRAENSVRYTGTAGTAFTNQSVDVATASLGNVVAGDSRVNLRLGTSGDSYLLRNAVLSVPTAGLQLTKTFDGTADTQSRTASERATFTVRITNTGAGTLRNIVVTDDQADCARNLGALVLAPLESTTYTCTATAPSSTGYVSTAEATAYTVVGNYLAQDSDSTTVLLSAIGLSKTSSLAPGASGRAGDVVTYTFTVTNTGQAPLTNIVITDPLVGLSAITFGTWPGTVGTLTAGQSVTATATYTLKQSDVDAGSIANTASVSADDNDGGVKPLGSSNRVTPLASSPGLSVTKAGALPSGSTGRVGDRITYTFTFTNTGNVTLANASLVDPLPGLSPPVVTWPTATTGALPVGQTATATATYVITQADVDAGFVRNTATVTARTPSGTTTSASSPQVQINTVASAPALTTTKSGSITSGSGGVGSVITYSFTARNAGNTTLTGVSIADPLPGLSALTYTWPGTSGRLAPGQSVTATATYTVTQADVDAGSVKNTAVGTATTPAGATLTVPSSQSTVATVAAAPSVNLTKAGALAPGSTGRAGDTVTYSFSLANTGNVTLTEVGISDPLSGLSALTYTWPGAANTLAPGQTVTATASYTLKQSDVDAGSVANSATAAAKPPVGARLTQTKSATVPVAPSGTLTVLKSGSVTSGDGGVGSTVTYRFSATNAGNVTLTQVALADPLSGLSTISATWPGTAGTLAPGQTVNGVATYTIKQADVDAGFVTNTASATGRTPGGATVTGTSPTTRVNTIAAAPASTTTKSASVSGTGRVGDVITYTVRTTNTGNVTLTGVSLTDPLPGLSAFTYTWPGTSGRLAPGQTVTGVATYTIKQADVDAGSVRNTASSSAVFGTTPVSSASAPVVTATAAAAPGLVTTKAGALQSGSTGRAGDTIVWTITLRNSGNVTLTGVSVADSLPGITAPSYGNWPSGTAGTLAPGQTVTATATSTISQTDVNAGAVSNTATGSGTPPTGAAITSPSTPATVSLASVPSLALVKSGAITSGSGGVGSTVTYTFRATNTGNVTLTGVAISDPHPGLSDIAYTWPGTAGTLQPNQTVTATATYAIRQSDVDAGSTKNTASVRGTPPTGAAVTASSAEVSVATVAAAPALTTTKSATGAGGGVGSTLTYTFRATNTGNVTLTGVAITDPLAGLSSLNYSWPGVSGVLAPGQSVTATATYTVRQADVDAGSVTNTSTARGTGGGATVTATSGAVVTATAQSAPAITVAKTGTLNGTGVAGDTITYAFTVRNPGNVTLTGVSLVDPLIGSTPISLSGWAGTAGTLAPGAAVTGTATYTLRQSDVDAGSVANIATATGQPPRGAAVTGTGPATVPIAAVPAISVNKTGAVTTGSGGPGSVVTFSFTIRNAGNVSLSAVSLSDSLPGLSTPALTWPGAVGSLAPGQTATGTATYTVRQADVDAGSVRNTASVSGRPPAGAVVSATSTATVPTLAAAPGLSVSKTSTVNDGGRVGDVVQYGIRVENTGNQTLTSVAIADELPGLSGLAITWPGTAGTLAPGQVATARGTYVITQADVNAGTIRNRATATATAPGGVPVSGAATRDTATATAAPQLALTKSAALPAGSSGRADDVVTYTFTLRNTGNVTLTGVGLTDPLPGLSAITVAAWPGADGVLQPGQSVTATATRALTQADVDAGAVANTATARGTSPAGTAVEQTASATLPLTSGPAMTMTKTGSYTTGSGAVGSVITYRFTAQNTGNVTLTGVTVTDPHTGLSPIALTWPGTAGRLTPGQQVTGVATYTVTQADVDAGSIVNTATTAGTPPAGAPVGATSPTVVLPAAQAGPALAATKSATVTGNGSVGDVVNYTITATNTGNVTLRSVAITDTLPGLTPLVYSWPGASGVLAPGQIVSATTSHTITQADVDAGTLVNVATVNGTAPNGTAVSAASPAATTPTVTGTPQLQVSKAGALPEGATGVAGETITWTVTIRNSGNVTLTGVAATDSLPGISALNYGPWPGGTAGTLAPGDTVTATATSVVRQSDVNAGSVANTVSASGAPARGQAATATSSATVPLAAAPRLVIDKTGVYTSGSGASGDTITYTYTVRNSGNVTLTGVTIADPHSGLSAITYSPWPSNVAGTLDPNQSVTATATYQVRQSDVNTGSVTDTATVSGRTPAGATVNAVSPTVVLDTVAAAPAITAGKSATVSGTGAVGDLVVYTLTASNTGNVTLTGVALSDPAPGLSPITYGQWPGASGTLQPGQTISATTTHRITQADVDAGTIPNTATAVGAPPTGPTVSNSASTTTSTAPGAADLEVIKRGALAPGSTGRAGDTVNFSFSLRNSGNVTLTGADLIDSLPGISPLAFSWPAEANTLAPGQTATATATYALTQADVDAGAVTNSVEAVGTPSRGDALSKTTGVTVPVAPSSSLSLSKTGVVSEGQAGEAGDTIEFAFTFANTGNVTLTGVELTDAIDGLVPTIAWPGAAGTLVPGATATATAVYVLTQDDVDEGSVLNTATVTGRTPGAQIVSATDDVTVATGAQRSQLALVKTGAPTVPDEAGAGDQITYAVSLTNVGNVTVSDIELTDDRADVTLSEITWPDVAGELAPGATATATATYTITQADVDAGGVDNTASATGTAPGPDGPVDVTVVSDVSTVATERSTPAITVQNSGSLPEGAVAGSVVTWTYVLTNTGNVTLTGVELADALQGTSLPVYDWQGGTPFRLGPTESVTATATTTLTQADVDAGSIVSVVTGRGTPPSGAAVTASAPATVGIAAPARLTIDKTADVTDGLAVDDVVTFSFLVTNTGALTIDGIAVSDALPGLSDIVFTGWPGGRTGALAPNDTVTGTATYTVTQPDVDRGEIVNSATVTGRPPSGAAIEASDTITVETVAADAALTFSKTTAQDAVVPGDVVEYAFTIANAGNVTLTDVSIADELEGLSAISYGAWPRGDSGVLEPGDRVEAIARYTVTQADFDAGTLTNTATASGQPPVGDRVSEQAEAEASADGADPALTVDKTGSLVAGSTGRAGDTVEYRFSVTNSGDVSISDITLADPLSGLSEIAMTWPADAQVLAPGQTATGVATYTLTQADVDSGSVVNTVTANGLPARGALPPASERSDTHTISIVPGAALSAVKTGVFVDDGIGRVGDVIQYEIVATNTGNVTITEGGLIDPMEGLYDVSIAWSGTPGQLNVGDSVTGRGKYRITQADVDAGSVVNTGTVGGETPTGAPVRVDTNTVTINTVLPAPGLAVTKSGETTGSGRVNDTIDYDFEITNTGNVTLTGVTLEDVRPDVEVSDIAWPDAAQPGRLEPGDVATAQGTLLITQEMVDAGRVDNTATATGIPPRDADPVSATSPVSSVATVAGEPALTVTDVGELAPEATGKAGDIVTWTYVLTNSGNVTLSGVALSDALANVGLPNYVWTTPEGVLGPQQSVTATATYTLTQADVDAGSVTSIVTGTGTPQVGAGVTATRPATLAIDPAPSLSLGKTASAPEAPVVGDVITYEFTIANRGNVTLSGVVLDDPLAGLSAPVITWPGANRVLAPGEVATASATYEITQADVDTGAVENSATATATTPTGATLASAPAATRTLTDAAAPAIATTKSAAIDGEPVVGQTVWYTIEVENTGNVTLDDVTVEDPLEGLSSLDLTWPQTEGVLAPGQVLTASGQYDITQADIDRGTIVNVATGAGTPPTGPAVDDESEENVVTLPAAAPDALLTKEGRLAAGSAGETGDLIEFSFRLQNTGNVTLEDITLTDELDGLSEIEIVWPSADGVLAPQAVATATATYALTQADIDRGYVDNVATSTSNPARGAAIERTDDVRVAVPQTPGLSAVKTGVILDGGIGQVGDVVQYEVVATNNGNVTITDGRLIDPMPNLFDLSIAWADPEDPGRLEVGDSVTGRAKYRLTQADVDRGFIENTAQVGGLTPGDVEVEAFTNTVRIQTVQPVPGLTVEKSGLVSGNGGVDAPVAYEFVIRNSGNVSIGGITLTDPMPGLSEPVIDWPGADGTLAPGQEATATAEYAITQADVDAGAVVNAATAEGSAVRGGTVTSAPGIATVPTQSIQASIVVEKSGALEPDASGIAGDEVIWSYALRNTSNVTLTGVTLVDRLPDTSAAEYVWPDPDAPGQLLPGQTVTATARYTLTQADVDRGSVASSVDGTGVPPRGADVTGEAAASVTIGARAALSATKDAELTGTGAVGDRIDYAFTITNDGNVTLTLVDLQDALVGITDPVFVWPGEPGVLAPGETVDATADYEITQADVDRGTVTNIATARGKPPVGDIITASTESVETTVAPAGGELTVTKDVTSGAGGGVGEEIVYAFTIENTGNVTVSDIVLDDPLAGLSTPVIEWPGDPGVLAPGDVATATARYTIVQTDVDAGTVENTATANGTARGGAVSGSDTVTTDTTDAAPALTVDKVGALTGGGVGVVGEELDYTFTVRNTGNQSLTGVTLTDPLVGLSDIVIDWPGAAGELPVGATVIGTATYALTQTDIDAGSVVNTVTADADPARGTLVPANDRETVAIPQAAALTAVKTGEFVGDGIGEVGDVIQYEIVATNTGNVTITEGRLIDPMEGLYDVSIAWSGTSGQLNVGDSVTGRGKYRITQADVDAGSIVNTGTVGGETPTGELVQVDTNTVTINTVLPAPALSVTKIGAPIGSGGVDDTIEYDFEIVNTGNVTLSGVRLTDALPGVSTPVVDWPGADGVLAPGDRATATAEYTITQPDVDAGEVRNVAAVRGLTPGGEETTAESLPSIVATEAGTPRVTITDIGALAPGSTGKAGDTVIWSYSFTNEGNVTLSSVALTDAVTAIGSPRYEWPGTPFALAPGQRVTATAEYTLTQADVDAGSVSSIVTGTGTPQVGAPATATQPATLAIAPTSGLVFQKTATLDAAGENGLGDAVTFGFRLENTGTVTLSDIRITDELTGIGPIEIDWPGAANTLAPGDVATGTAAYAISQDDVDRGQVENTASVRATTPAGASVTGSSTIPPLATEEQQPSIHTVKGGTYMTGDGGVGSVIEYTFDVTNTGNVTLRLIRVVDELEGVGTPDMEFPSATGILAPGATATGVARYTVTQADVDAGSITNIATSFGTSPRGTVVSGTSEPFEIDTAPPSPGASAIETTQTAKLADGDTGVLGDTVEYVFTIRNSGNLTLDDVTLDNTVPGLTGLAYTWPDPANPGRLLPGQSVTITAVHTVTQTDVDAGEVRNTATGTGERPRGGGVSDESVETVVPLVAAAASLEVTKKGTRLGDGSVGTGIDYAFLITNSGAVTLTGVALTDDLAGLGPITYGAWPGAEGRLGPGESVTASAGYVITQADVDAGAVRNIASATGETPQGTSVTDDSAESIVPTTTAAPSIVLEKSQQLADGAAGRPGDTVEYSYTFRNDGNVTLTGVGLVDGQPGISAITITWPGEPGVLAPGETATGVATYVLRPADVDGSGVTSTATVSGRGGGTAVSDTDDGGVTVVADPSIRIEKTSTLETVAQQGAGVRYEIRVTNDGNVTLSGVAVTDRLAGLSPLTAVWPGTPGTLAAGQTAVFTARYVIGQPDVDRGSIVNTASVVGTAPDETVVSAEDENTVPVPRTATIDLRMKISIADGQSGYAGDTLVFTYTATNTGTTTLTGVKIVDPYPGLSNIEYIWPGEPGVLLPGQTVTAIARVTITPEMEGTVVSSQAQVTSIEVETSEVVADTAAAEVELPERLGGILPIPNPLPPTGADPTIYLGAAGVLLIGGLVLLIVARRRRDHSAS